MMIIIIIIMIMIIIIKPIKHRLCREAYSEVQNKENNNIVVICNLNNLQSP